jgi:hypothetical protein
LGARTHARLDRAELMLDCLAPYTHLLRMLVEPALNSLEYMLVLPSRDTRCYFWIDPREEIVGVYMAAAPSPMRVYYRRMVRRAPAGTNVVSGGQILIGSIRHRP